ncbi:hypothetical protein DQ384_33645 [Sphaerisporangium album]|uniref:Aminoacyl-transfer RNA synthetases class-II family profile domain-containing protein n=1 Tax=Sphaerisporangium album TaxID=509200 RepID=A0A367F167_9ACTN|nr:hypothetical protein [Sphaerisporangium album]RCG24001.1 hypothetical protein DQ384_33645 [Sphaerisporangium album]
MTTTPAPDPPAHDQHPLAGTDGDPMTTTRGVNDRVGDRGNEGLDVLGPDELRLLREFDALILSWADEAGAVERRYPFLLRPDFLDGVGHFQEFPHLSLPVSAADPERLLKSLRMAERPLGAVPAEALDDARYVLPSAACHSIYQSLAGQAVPGEGAVHTTLATCFRIEERYGGPRRPLALSMREIVHVGTAEGAKEHVARSKERVLELAARLGLEMRTEVATDPFFDRTSSRAIMQLLFPDKEEFVVGGLVVGSVDHQGDLFGKRCGIRLPDGTAARTGCVAFHLERWVHVLTARFGDASAAADAILELR